jgi:hypothetical protein
MSIWKPVTIDVEPDVRTSSWSVYQVTSDLWPIPTNHIVCWYGEGRVSSQIIDWDSDKRIAITDSGRRYHLAKDSRGPNPDALYVFSYWKQRNQIQQVTDVSDQYQ